MWRFISIRQREKDMNKVRMNANRNLKKWYKTEAIKGQWRYKHENEWLNERDDERTTYGW